MNSSQEIREIILKKLKAKNVSANKMLLELKLNTSLVNDLRKGQMPAADKLGLIADFLDVSVDYLLGTKKKAAPEELALDETDFELKEIMSDMNTEEIKMMVKYASFLKHQRNQ